MINEEILKAGLGPNGGMVIGVSAGALEAVGVVDLKCATDGQVMTLLAALQRNLNQIVEGFASSRGFSLAAVQNVIAEALAQMVDTDRTTTSRLRLADDDEPGAPL